MQEFEQEHHLDAAHLVPPAIRPQLDALGRSAGDASTAHWVPILHEAVARLSQLPGVMSAAVYAPPPFELGLGAPEPTFSLGDPRTTSHWYRSLVPAFINYVSPGAFRTLRVRLLAGRHFLPSDGDAFLDAWEHQAEEQEPTAPVIVNQAMADRFWPGEDAIGKIFFSQPRLTVRVVGVVSNFRESAGELIAQPTVFFPPFWSLDPRGQSYIVRMRRGVSASQLATAAGQALNELVPGTPRPRVTSLEDMTTASQANLRLALVLLGCFSVLGTIVAALSVYAAATLMAAARTREMGIRIALGAHADQIRGLAVWRSVRLVLVALPLGALCAWGLARSLSHWLFQVGAADPATYAASITFLAVIALVAGLIPARRASRVDPVEALRQE